MKMEVSSVLRDTLHQPQERDVIEAVLTWIDSNYPSETHTAK